MNETPQGFETGKSVKILSGSHKDEEAELDMPVSSRGRVWIVILENGERLFYETQELQPIISLREKFRQFLEN